LPDTPYRIARNRRQLIILGAGVMQGPAIAIAREMGLETIVVDGDPKAVNAGRADRFEHIDLKDTERIEDLARSLMAEGRGNRQNGGGDGAGTRLGGIMTAGTDFSATVAWVAERLGLPGIPYETALNASDKGRMRHCFKAAGVPSPEFTVLTCLPGADVPLPGYPTVVKPVDNMGGRGCRRVDSRADLDTALPEALSFSRSGQVIVESYMEGPEFSVDAIVYHGEITICGLADRHIFFPPFFIEMGHTMPTIIDDDDLAALLKTFIDGVRALGLLDKNAVGAAKGDIKLTPRGPMIGEIAARLSGGYMSGWTYPYASGVEVTRGAILAALGEKPDGLSPRRDWTCAERAFISIPGRVRAVRGLREAQAAPYIKDLFLRAEPGAPVAFPENNVAKCGNVLAAAPDRSLAVEAAENAARSVLIALEAPNAETEAFLAGAVELSNIALDLPVGIEPAASTASTPLRGASPPTSGTPYLPVGIEPATPASFPLAASARALSWPPSAYTLTPEIAAALAELPDPEPPSLPIGGEPALIPFPALTTSGLTDWVGRPVSESLDAVRRLTGLALPEKPFPDPETAAHTPGAAPFLGRRFWAALIRGGYQGAAYTVETLLEGYLPTGRYRRGILRIPIGGSHD
jgi:biotin carboxylase